MRLSGACYGGSSGQGEFGLLMEWHSLAEELGGGYQLACD